MIIISLISLVFACKPVMEQRRIFPTINEQYSIDMDQLFFEDCNFYKCKGCSDVIYINNASQMIANQSLDQSFISVAENLTNFIGLSQSQIILFKKTDNFSLIMQNEVEIPSQLVCFNVIFYDEYDILIDCYEQNNSLQFYFLREEQFYKVYNNENYSPVYSQLQVFINYQTQYILYAQYFDTYQVLTILEYQNNLQFQNLSVYNQTNFKNFKLSFNYIYLINDQFLYQIAFKSTIFTITSNITVPTPIISFYLYKNLKQLSLCDQIILIRQNSIYLWQYLGCQNNIIQIDQQKLPNQFIMKQTVQIICNDNFLILYDQEELQIFRNGKSIQYLQILELNQTIIFLQTTENIIYSFGTFYNAYLIQVPKLTANQVQATDLIYYEVKIFAFSTNRLKINQQDVFVHTNIQVVFLNQSDLNIYIQYKQNQTHVFENEYDQIFQSYSGQLLQANTYYYFPTIDFGFFKDTTIQQKLNFTYSFQQTYLLYPIYEKQAIILLAQTNNSLQFYLINAQPYYIEYFNEFSISQIINIQLGYNQLNNIIAGIQVENNSIICYYYQNYYLELEQKQTLNFEFEIQQYVLNFDSVIILTNRTIYIYYNCQQNQSNIIDQNKINKIFNQQKNYIFNPINITQNVQYLSSILVINNQTNILIVSLINNDIIPISKIQNFQNQKIFQVNIVKYRLIVSFLENQTITFQVWNLINIFVPFFEKSLYSQQIMGQFTLNSDNKFFYVLQNNNVLFIYNPDLPQHQALITKTIVSNNYFSSTSLSTDVSTILINNSLFEVQPFYLLSFYLYDISQVLQEYPELIYNFTIISQLNLDTYLYTENNLLIYFKESLSGLIQSFNYTRNLTKSDIFGSHFYQIIQPDQNSQITQCWSSDCLQTYQTTNNSFFQNFSCNYNLVVLVYQDFIIQNNVSLAELNEQTDCSELILLNYAHLNFDICLISGSYSYFLYSICQNQTANYLIEFDLSNKFNVSILNIWQLNFNFQNFLKFQVLESVVVILGVINQTQNINSLYYFNQQQSLISITGKQFNCLDFVLLKIHLFQQKYIIIIYINDHLLFYNVLLFDQQNGITIILQNQTLIELNQKIYKLTKFSSIVLLDQDNLKFELLIITNSPFNYITKFSIFFDDEKFVVQFLEVSRLMPQVYQSQDIDFSQSINSIYSNGYLLLLNSQYQVFYQSFYNLTYTSVPYVITEINKPVLMIQQQQVWGLTNIAAFYDTQTNTFNITYIAYGSQVYYQTFHMYYNFTCNIQRKDFRQKYFSLSFMCYNDIFLGTIQYTYFLVYESMNVVYNLIIITLVIFSIIIFSFIWIHNNLKIFRLKIDCEF